MKLAPYGSWPSPITPEMAASGQAGYGSPLIEGDSCYWTLSLPEEGGRVTLMQKKGQAAPCELTPDANVRSSVQEYGGAAYAVAGDILVYTNLNDSGVYMAEAGGPARRIAFAQGMRYAGFAVLADTRRVLCVREDHRGESVINTLVLLSLDGDNADGGEVFASGADFYYAPVVSPESVAAWMEWDLPNMPWDDTRIGVKSLSSDSSPEIVASKPGVSYVYPQWAGDGALCWLSDESGFWNFEVYAGGNIEKQAYRHPFDFCGPAWTLGAPPYGILGDRDFACAWIEGGWSHYGIARGDGSLEEAGKCANAALSPADGGVSLAILSFSNRPNGVFAIHWEEKSAEELTEAVRDPEIEALAGTGPEEVSWGEGASRSYAWYWPPKNPGCIAPGGKKPPAIVLSHGGPTGFSPPSYDLTKLFWTSRGIGVLDVNYGGSTGYGRAYRKRLDGNWGVVDVADCKMGALTLARGGQADPQKIAIMGGSAGGYTTLACLAFTDTFGAGISLYGIGDLETLARDTHKFESRYLDSLIAPYPEGREVYLERSPVYHLQGLSAPMLILQGKEDTVVPMAQAVDMAKALEEKGIKYELVLYDGEGHGFRKKETNIDAYAKMLSFLGRSFGFYVPK